MNFGEAIAALQEGEKVCRSGWVSFGAVIQIKNAQLRWWSNDHPEQDYIATTSDIFAVDWSVVDTPAKK